MLVRRGSPTTRDSLMSRTCSNAAINPNGRTTPCAGGGTKPKNTLAVDETTGETWWRENSKESYNSGLESLADALRNFSKSRKGQRKGRRMGFPRFKSKDKAVPGFAYTTGSFGLID